MKVLHIVAGLWENTGGPSEVIPNLCMQLVNLGHEVTLISVDGNNAASLLKAKNNGVHVVLFEEWGLSQIRQVKGLFSFLQEEASKYHVIHNHGHWLYPNWLAAYFAKKFQIPLVTTPHGTLVPGMLAVSKIKKLISWALFDRHIIHESGVVHCLSETESQLTKLKLGKLESCKVVVIPNGANSLSFNEPGHNFPKKKKILLYMSRVSRIKGIEDLVNIWCRLKPNNYTLRIVGPWDDNLVSIKIKAENHPNIDVVGPCYGDARFKFLKESDAFILPSYGEGLPTALLEAAASGHCILYTKECNFDLLEKADGGIVFSAGEAGLEASLYKLFEMTDSEIFMLRNKAHNLAKVQYSWGAVGIKWEATYAKLVN